jgi:hypothetical protein
VTVLTYNPFNNTGPIENADQFFNRKIIVNQVLTRLFTEENLPNISIIGLRKSGKSSFIKHLMRSETIAEYGYDASKHLFVYVDCGRLSSNAVHTADFYQHLHQLVIEHLAERMPSVEQEITHLAELDLHDPSYWQKKWERLLTLLARQKISLSMLLDQFHLVVMQENLLREGLFGSLRVYGGNSNFSWVTCTYQTLPSLFEDAFKTYEVPETKRRSESDFFNQFTTNSFYYMGLFAQDEIQALVYIPLQKTSSIEFTRAELRAIFRFGGHFPYFIQRISSYFFQAHLEKTSSVETVVQACLQEVESLWEGYWEKLTFQQRIVLYSVASQHPLDSEIMFASIKTLQNMGLIYEEFEHYFPFSEEFGRYIIRSKKDFAPGQPVNEGQELWRQYKVESIAGRTLHSQVVKAQDMHLTKRHWAIKLLCINPTITSIEFQQLREQLMREAKILDSLEHSNIGEIHSVKHDVPAIIMPWIEGESLDTLLARREQENEPPFSPLETITIALQLASALEHAHQRGVVHRDIKPNNIIMSHTSNGQLVPILIDFDVAHAKDQQTVTRAPDGSIIWVGNEYYAAPEQFLNPRCSDAPMDIFALSVVLYELLTNRRPYPSYNKYSFLRHEKNLAPPIQEDIPAPLYHLLCDMLLFEPQERPNARAVVERLQECQQTLTINQPSQVEHTNLEEQAVAKASKRFWPPRVSVNIGKILERIIHNEKP